MTSRGLSTRGPGARLVSNPGDATCSRPAAAQITRQENQASMAGKYLSHVSFEEAQRSNLSQPPSTCPDIWRRPLHAKMFSRPTTVSGRLSYRFKYRNLLSNMQRGSSFLHQTLPWLHILANGPPGAFCEIIQVLSIKRCKRRSSPRSVSGAAPARRKGLSVTSDH